jgi:hypothetical protein
MIDQELKRRLFEAWWDQYKYAWDGRSKGLAYSAFETALDLMLPLLEQSLEANRFYADHEMWMIKNNKGWIPSSPKRHGDEELVRGYSHPGTDWVGSIRVGGKTARQAIAQIESELKRITE